MLRKPATASGSGLTTKAALDYVRLGWSVIPIQAGTKRPLIRWQAHQYRHADLRAISDWFRCWPDANLAIVTGLVSGLVVLDVDPTHGGDEGLAGLERGHDPLSPTVEARTGGGGRHLYFTHPGEIVHNRVGIAPGVDLRGDGGYVVAPPSLHASGAHYCWVLSPQVRVPALLPGWLAQFGLEDQGLPHGHPLEHWRRLLQDGVAVGGRNKSVASLTGHLLWHGVDPDIAVELLLCWNSVRCRPPLDPDEVVRTVEGSTRRHQRPGDGDARTADLPMSSPCSTATGGPAPVAGQRLGTDLPE